MTTANPVPSAVTAALQQMDRAERKSRVLRILYVVLAICVPFLLLFRTAQISQVEWGIIVLLLYNTLFLMWVKHDVNSNAARVFRVLTHLGLSVRELKNGQD